MVIASAISLSASLIILSALPRLVLAYVALWHLLQIPTILSRDACHSSLVRRATLPAFTSSRRAVGLPAGSRTPRPLRIVALYPIHSASSSGSRRARKPQEVITPWSPSPIWQVWQVGARPVSPSIW